MKVACVLLVHKNPGQIARLIERLTHPDIDCWVHIDKKCDSKEFRTALSVNKHVFFVPGNINIGWGCYNMVEAMLLAIRGALDTNDKYDYVSFLSGQDYLLKPPHEFLKYLTENNGREFMSIQKLEASPGYMVRIKKYHFNGYSFPAKKLLQKFVNKVLPDRKFPDSLEVRKGSQWITISGNACKYVLAFIDKNPRVKNYFKWVDSPDEFFFQTILFNSDFRNNIYDGVFHFTNWSQHNKHPKLLTMQDREELWSSYYFFARKFDINTDEEILNLIDREKLSWLYKQH